jgi:peptidoglycan/xylan/chitin deacetylase (PgdA/CDA1 family)
MTGYTKHGRVAINTGLVVFLTATILSLLVARSNTLHAHRPHFDQSPASPAPSAAPEERRSETEPVIEAVPQSNPPSPSARKTILRRPMDLVAEASILRQGDQRSKIIALTFDDGPHPAYTHHLLAVLDRYGVKATFFVVGKMAAKHPDSVREIFDAGHVVGNHTWDHRRLAKISDPSIAAEWEQCRAILYSITGRRAVYCRPPGCTSNADVVLSAARQGMTTVLYTVNSRDYTLPGKNAILNRLLSLAKGGDIILMHDGVQETIDILPKFIEVMHSRGYEFVTVEEMDASLSSPTIPSRDLD